MVSSSGDPMVFIPLKDAQEAQFLKDNQAIWQSRHRTESNTPFSPNTVSEPDKLTDSQFSNHLVNAILVRIKPHTSADEVAESIRRWKHLTVYTRVQMENILIGKLIATSAKQISMFLIILAVVSAAIVAFIIYTLTMDKIREIAVLKLIGTRNRTIAAMILQQALALGVIGFAVGKITATFAAPLFPKYVLLIPTDSLIGFFAVLIICALASVIAIRIALQVDPAEAIGG
jgi:putative ABC transport system permease protein